MTPYPPQMPRVVNAVHRESSVDPETRADGSGIDVDSREYHGACDSLEDAGRVSLGSSQSVCRQGLTIQDASRFILAKSKGKRKTQDSRGEEASPPILKRGERNFSSARTRLTMAQKEEVLQLLQNRVRHEEIAQKFHISRRTVSSISNKRQSLEKKARSTGYNSAAKSSRPAAFPKIEEAVVLKVEEARRCNLSVTREVIQLFARKVKDDMLDAHDISEAEKSKLKGFTASLGWVRNFVRRQGLVTKAVHREADGVDAESKRPDMHENREACKKLKFTPLDNGGKMTCSFFRRVRAPSARGGMVGIREREARNMIHPSR